jgi:hypothetical protein
MHLFNQKEKISIPIKCKLCLKEIEFEVSAEEYNKTESFPIVKENIHGDPPHKLIVHINKYLEIEDFAIENQLKADSKEISQEVINTVLADIGLNEEEIHLYFLTAGRDIISLGEMALFLERSKEECKQIADKFVEKGLYKEIISETPHYAPLPPYAALFEKLKDLQENISKVKDNIILIKKFSSELNNTLQKLEISPEEEEQVDDIRNIMFNIKNEVLENIQIKEISPEVQIKEIPKEIGNLDDYTNNIMKSQISVIKNQFKDINSKSIQIIKAQIANLNDKIDEMQTIISDNLKKLRLSVLEQTICGSVEKLLMATLKDIQGGLDVQLSVNEMVFNDELNSFIEKFNQEFIDKFKTTIGETIAKLDNIDLDVKFKEDELIEDLTTQFNKSLQKAEEKITKICSGNIKSLASIKGLLTDRVESQIEGTIDNILDQLQVQEQMTKYFWEQSKKRASLTMKNVWFIHSVEAAKAHIDEEISRAKLRILIVAPQITDISLDSIKSCPSHVNIRIAAYSEPSIPEHKKILNEITKMGNIDYRNRQLQNIWGINRDYEEIIVCVLSKEKIKGKEYVEIAGIGSIIEEHIKLFVPILEDVWVGAEKRKIESLEEDKKIGKENSTDLLNRIKQLRKKGRNALEKGSLKDSHRFFEKITSIIDNNFQ